MSVSACSSPPIRSSTERRRTTTDSDATPGTTTRSGSTSGPSIEAGLRPRLPPSASHRGAHTMKTKIVIAIAIVASGCTTLERSRSLADPKTPAKAIAQQVCSNCHGIDGNSVSPNFPRLAAQQKDYFIAQLKEFRSHDRLDPAGFEYMWGLSRSLTDAQIEGLADYFAAQKPTPPKVRVAANFATGREAFR